MGFDPRHWSSSSPSSRGRGDHVTSNVEALLAENDALRRELQRLNRELDRLRRQQRQRPRPDPPDHRRWNEPSAHPPPRVSREQVQAWGESLAQQKRWAVLRKSGLDALIDHLNRSSFHSRLTLQERLDRLVSGLGTDLVAAIGNRSTKKTAAVLAAFALYGVRANEWLDEDPQRVVSELCLRQQQHAGNGSGSSRRSSHDAHTSGRRTRSDHRRTDRPQTQAHQTSRTAALATLELGAGASHEEIKQAFRRLVKRHHPNVGGSAEAFRQLNEAYQLLLG